MLKRGAPLSAQGLVPPLTSVLPVETHILRDGIRKHMESIENKSLCVSFLQYDLVCDREDLNDISQSIYMLGLFLGSMIFGPLSDR